MEFQFQAELRMHLHKVPPKLPYNELILKWIIFFPAIVLYSVNASFASIISLAFFLFLLCLRKIKFLKPFATLSSGISLMCLILVLCLATWVYGSFCFLHFDTISISIPSYFSALPYLAIFILLSSPTPSYYTFCAGLVGIVRKGDYNRRYWNGQELP